MNPFDAILDYLTWLLTTLGDILDYAFRVLGLG